MGALKSTPHAKGDLFLSIIWHSKRRVLTRPRLQDYVSPPWGGTFLASRSPWWLAFLLGVVMWLPSGLVAAQGGSRVLVLTPTRGASFRTLARTLEAELGSDATVIEIPARGRARMTTTAERAFELVESEQAVLAVWAERPRRVAHALLYVVSHRQRRVLLDIVPIGRGDKRRQVERALAARIKAVLRTLQSSVGEQDNVATALGAEPAQDRGISASAHTGRSKVERATSTGTAPIAFRLPVACDTSSAEPRPLIVSALIGADATFSGPSGSVGFQLMGTLSGGIRIQDGAVVFEAIAGVGVPSEIGNEEAAGRVSVREVVPTAALRALLTGDSFAVGLFAGVNLRILAVRGVTPDGRRDSADRAMPTELFGIEGRAHLFPQLDLRIGLGLEAFLSTETFNLDGIPVAAIGSFRGFVQSGLILSLD